MSALDCNSSKLDAIQRTMDSGDIHTRPETLSQLKRRNISGQAAREDGVGHETTRLPP
jgi:hypothetical protein